MIFTDDIAVIEYVKTYSKITPKFITDARNYSKELCALIEGEGFLDELINRIEYVESENKAKARKKYSRDLRDMFSRISKPIENVFSAIGGTKNYNNGDAKISDAETKKLLSIISNVRDGKSIERYIETQWMPLYHTDPSGVQYMSYVVEDGQVTQYYPTYHSITVIRNYIQKGQLVENILFEPIKKEDDTQVWVLVDDAKQYTINQNGDNFTIDVDPLKTFEHPFGICPVIINSNLTDKYKNRLSPFHNILETSKEYARDLSFKTILKAVHGSPLHWRREAICATCHGTRKDGDEVCKSCSPTGKSGKKDVTDIVILPFNPDADTQTIKGDDVAGYVSPDVKTWDAFTKELEFTEDLIYKTMWGVSNQSQVNKTATEVFADMQPQINKLQSYSNQCEWMEWMMTEWCANLIAPAKDKEESISLIVYGTRYLLNGIDTIQEKYTAAKKSGVSIAILDSIYEELLTVKYKNDIECLKIEQLKARLEPYLHWSPMEINTFFGANEVARKLYFQQWWSDLQDNDLLKKVDELKGLFETDFKSYLPTVNIIKPIVAPATIPAPTE